MAFAGWAAYPQEPLLALGVKNLRNQRNGCGDLMQSTSKDGGMCHLPAGSEVYDDQISCL